MRNDLRPRRALVALGTVSLVAGVALAVTPPAQATTSPTTARPAAVPRATSRLTPRHTNREAKAAFKVTIVARTCNSYADIMANLARNNIQESLMDLGPDTVYGAGQPVSPSVEDSIASQANNCRPLVGWQFKLGRGITGKTAANDYLSTVTNPFPETIKTVAQTPELNANGGNTGGKLQGAVTITLNAEEQQLAQSGNQLWLQGGLVNDPLLNGPSNPVFDPPQAFGALRCSIDNLNGDNVEWIGFPSDTTHAFCYYYTVSPPPAAATIIVKKSVVGEPNNNDIFAFGGNVSYVPGGGPSANDNPFIVQAGSTGTSFVRAANTADPWTFYEETSAGFTLTGVNCTSNLESKVVVPGTVNIDTPVQVTLVPGDVVTCTFSNTRKLAGLTVQKITTAGTGTFDFTASSPSSKTTSASVTTDEAGTPKDVLSLTDATGSFTSTENLSAGADPNSWTLDSVTCNDQAISPTPAIGSPATTVIPPGATYNCVYVNTPNGKIVIHKKSIGGVGTFHFGIIPITGDTLRGAGGISTASATTQSDGVPVTALVESGSLTNLPFQKYAVVEFGSEPTAAGEWVLTAATCDAADTTPINAPSLTGAVFTLTDHQPTINCTFDNTLFKTSTLDVSKSISGDTSARTGPVTIVSTCNDGNTDTLTGAPGHNGPFAGNTLVFNNFMFNAERQSTLSCTVHETATGVEKGGTVSTSWSLWLNGVELTSDASSTAVVPIDPNGAYQVKFINQYKAAPTTPSPSPSDGTGGAGGGSNGGDLPHTGGNPWSLALMLGGAAAIVSGAIIGRRRRVVR